MSKDGLAVTNFAATHITHAWGTNVLGSVRCPDVDFDMDTSDDDSTYQLSTSLTTINYDVQSLISSLLSPSDLSSLMKTCHTLYDVGLLPLCAFSTLPLNRSNQIMSFIKFLRLDIPSTTRAPFIKEININLDEYRTPLNKASYLDVPKRGPLTCFMPTMVHPVEIEQSLLKSRNSALDAILNVLCFCRNLQRLRIGRWYDDIPTSILYNIIYRAVSSLPLLEELHVPTFPLVQWGNTECSALTNSQLRKLIVRTAWSLDVPNILSTFHHLAPSLVELDLPVSQWIALAGISFPHIKRLGIQFPASEDVVTALAQTFPNMTHLILRGSRPYHLCHTPRASIEEGRSREHSLYQWQALSRAAWPPLEMVSADSACTLYTLAFPCHVPCVSVGYSAGDPPDDMLPIILTDARPSCLEMRISQVHFKFLPLPQRFATLLPGDSTVSLQRFVLSLEGHGILEYLEVSSLLIAELQRTLSALSVTHLLLKHSIGYFRHTLRVVRTLCADASMRATAMARAIPSLRWIGVSVQVKDGPNWLYSWDISPHPRDCREDFAFDAPSTVVLTKLSEDAGWDVLRSEGMDEIARVS